MEARSRLSPLKQAFLALEEAEARIAELEQASTEAIAIVGAGCRFPGGATHLDAYADLLRTAGSGIERSVADRLQTLSNTSLPTPVRDDVRSAGLVEDVDRFDPQFFGISPREAVGMDPQQRFLLEVAWQALDHAAIAPSSLYGTKTGVYVGLCTSDYGQLLLNARGSKATLDPHFASGVAHSIATGRISYAFGFEGPSVAIDTACSSSLVAVHLACEGLRSRSCDVALAGGVNLILSPEASLAFSSAGMLAPDGRCKAFDQAANGFVRGEGCGIAVLKRLRDAEAAGDRIWAVIRGSAVNQDGPSSGLTVPNGAAQQALLRQALTNARVLPQQVGYVEAHGTGTSLGDPIEAEALGQVYQTGHTAARPLWIGSVKTNIGHLEAAAGIASLLKVVLALNAGELLPQLNFAHPSPHIRWNDLPIRVVTERQTWEPIDGRRIAGVSAFGFSGTNAHLIVEAAPERKPQNPLLTRGVDVLTISAKTENALRRSVESYCAFFETMPPGVRWADVCHTANIGRAHFQHRLSIRAKGLAAGSASLVAYRDGQPAPEVVETTLSGRRPRVAFWFGAILADPLHKQLGAFPTFAAAVQRCSGAPADFSALYGLSELWKSWGVSPRVVWGEGMGAWVAAVVSGTHSLPDALACVRSGERHLLKGPPEFDQRTVHVLLGESSNGHAPENGIRCLRPDVPVIEALAIAIQSLDAAGVEIDWKGWDAGFDYHPVTLPSYPFERERFWVEPGTAPSSAVRPMLPASHPLLGHPLRSPLDAIQFESDLTAQDGALDWLEEHRVQRSTVLPGAGLIELLLAALRESGAAGPGQGLALEHLVLLEPLRWKSPEERPTVQVVVEPTKGKPSRLRVLSLPRIADAKTPNRAPSAWRLHVEAQAASLHPRTEALTLEHCRARCLEPVDRARFYSGLADRGLEFGPSFQGIAELWRGDGEALGRIERDPAIPAQWLLYPPQLDACLQVAAAALTGQDAIGADALYLPFEIGRVQLHAPLGPTVFAHVRVTSRTPHAPACDLTLFAPDGHLLAECTAIVFRPAKTAVASESWFYGVTWQPAPLAAPLPDRVAPLAASLHLDRYNVFFEQLEALSLDYVAAAFRQLGPDPRSQVAPGRLPVFQNLLNLCVEAGVDPNALPPPKDLHAKVQALATRFPFASSELALVSRCGSQLAAVLTGEIEPQQVLFSEASFDQIASVYKSSLPAQFFNRLLATSLESLLPRFASAPVRILEVGAGTGATTSYVLPLLARHPASYVWSDVSPYFVKRARTEFASYPHLEFRTLDIGTDALPEDLAGTFDIVIAANVLHATASLSVTLSNVTRLLKPDGHLLLLEITGRQRWADITLGLSPDWLAFEDTGLRTDYGILPSGAWARLLLENGFADVTTLPAPSDAVGVLARQELLMARKTAAAIPACLVLGRGQHASAALLAQGCLLLPDSAESLALASHVVFCCPSGSPEGPLTQRVKASIQQFLALVQSLVDRGLRPQLSLVTEGAHAAGSTPTAWDLSQSPLSGMASAIALEHPEFRLKRIDLEPKGASVLAAELFADDAERWIAYRGGQRLVARLERRFAGAKRLALVPGTGVTRLAYLPVPRPPLRAGEIEIEVRATALNFRDVLNATGARSDTEPLGTECAGIITRLAPDVSRFQVGDAVSAIAAGCFGTYATANAVLAFAKPPQQSFSDAAALPVAYLTADFCLNTIAHMQPGERILIHAAAGGVGLAAVHLARQAGLRVYATAGSPRKRDFLRALGLEHVFSSRSLAFATELPEPVDIVLNSLTGDLIDAGLSVLAPGGRFVELGKADLRQPQGVAYFAIDLTRELESRPQAVRATLDPLLKRVEAATLPQLPVVSFPVESTVEAFQTMAEAKHIGKVVITSDLPAERPLTIDPQAAYLVTGGLSGLGLAVADWLTQKGARHLILTGRRGATPEAAPFLARFETAGIQASVIEADISRIEDVERVLRASAQPLKGVFHCAGTLDNAAITRQTWRTFETVLKPKVDGAWNLHVLTASSPLDYFVLFSSWASLQGSKGQANHCAASFFLDALASYRQSTGLPAISIDWGAWSEIGSAADPLTQSRFAASGVQPLSPKEGLTALETVLTGPFGAQAGVMPIEWAAFLSQFEPGETPPLYQAFAPHKTELSLAASPAAFEPDLLAKVRRAPAAKQDRLLVEALQDLAGSVLGMRGADVDPDAGLADLGMDSLLAVELRNALAKELGRPLPATTFFDYPTIRALSQALKTEFSPEAPDTAEPVTADQLDVLSFIEGLSDEQADTLLAGKNVTTLQ